MRQQPADPTTLQPDCQASRRGLLTGGSGLLLSGAALGLLAGCQSAQSSQSSQSSPTEQDAALLNQALALEYEAIFAYQAGADSGLLSADQLTVALLFQSHHKQHRDLLIRTVERIGGTAVVPQDDAIYAERLQLQGLASATDVMALAQALEKGAAEAYIGVLPKFSDPIYGQFSARIAADEAMHWTALTGALGQPLPDRALTFAAT